MSTDFVSFLKSDAGRKYGIRRHGGRATQRYVTQEVLTDAPGAQFESWADLLAYLQRHGDLHSDALETARTLWGRFTRQTDGS